MAEFLTFRLGAEEYGIDILRVQEIRSYEVPTRISQAPEFMRGVVNLRGVIVPIIDLRVKLGCTQADGSVRYDDFTVVVVLNVAGRVVGAVVDAVSDVLAVQPEDVRPAPSMNATVDTSFIQGLVSNGQRTTILLDIVALMSSPDMGLIGTADLKGAAGLKSAAAPAEQGVEHAHQIGKVLLEAGPIDEVSLAGHGKEFGRCARAIGIQPRGWLTEALGQCHLLPKPLPGGGQGLLPQGQGSWAFQAHEAAGQGRAAIGLTVAGVELVHKLVDDQVAALLCAQPGQGHLVPGQHHRAMAHGLAQHRLAIVVHHARLIAHLAQGQHLVRVNHDAHEIAVGRQPQVHHRQASLHSDRQRHGVGHHQTLRTVELLGPQEARTQHPQALLLTGRQLRNERQFGQHRLPQALRDALCLALVEHSAQLAPST